MGNRAAIQFKYDGKHTQAFYVQWNGGIESVKAFIDVLNKDYSVRGDAAPARFAQLVGNFFGGGLALYPWVNGRAIDEDNGTFIVDTTRNEWSLRRLSDAKSSSDAFDQEYYEGVKKAVREANDPIFLRA